MLEHFYQLSCVLTRLDDGSPTKQEHHSLKKKVYSWNGEERY